MNRGYVKLWRKIEDSAVFADAHLLQLFLWCLMRATHKTYTVPARTGRGQTVVTLQPGQFIFGRNAAAKALRCPPSSIRNRIDSLRRRGMVDIQPDTHFSVVTIIKWHLYQQDAEELGQATRQASGQPKDTYKNVKNERLTSAPAKDAGSPSKNEKILGYDTVGRPLYAEPEKAAR
jgi:hypothetical protein